jgi:hypothetical protein
MTDTATQAPAWERFHEMSGQVHEMLIGAAQCRNHLTAALGCWDECDDAERKSNIEDALLRLTRAGI